jgi:hypothetical protein
VNYLISMFLDRAISGMHSELRLRKNPFLTKLVTSGSGISYVCYPDEELWKFVGDYTGVKAPAGARFVPMLYR